MTQHIVHLTSVHRTPDVRIYFKECRSLAEKGYQVTLVAPGPSQNYTDPSINFIPVTARTGRLKRMTLTTLEVLRSALDLKGDAYHIHSPELIPVGMFLRMRGKKVIFDAHEDLPDQVISKPWIPTGLRGAVAFGSTGLIKIASRMFSGIVAATPAIAEDYDARRTIVIRNFPLDERDLGTREDIPYVKRPLHLIYAGGLSEARGIRQIVSAMSIVGPSKGSSLILLGRFMPESMLSEMRALPGWEYVDYRGQQSRTDMNELFRQSRLGIVTFLAAPNHMRSEPNKLFEYMQAGLPVLASNFVHWQQFVTDVGVGRQVDPGDPEAIAREILWFLDHPEEAKGMGRRGRELAMTKFSWGSQADKLANFYANQIFAGEP